MRRLSIAALLISVLVGWICVAEGPTIAVVMKTFINDPFMVNIANFARARGEELGAIVETYAASSHAAVEEQISIVESLIAREVDAIILAPLDSNALSPVINEAMDAGIPVILVDTDAYNANYVTLISTGNIRASKLAAEYAAILLNFRGKVAQIEGDPTEQTALDRRTGFHEGIAQYPEIELVASISGYWTTPGAVDATEAILQSHPDVDLIFASSDMMGVGAAEVLRRTGRTDVILITFDGLKEGTDLILEGISAGDVAQNAKFMGERAVELAMQIILGEIEPEDVPEWIDSGAILVHPWNVDWYRRELLGIEE